MTIQLSVVVWTVLCFGALMLILHHLLFKPVLRVLDARRERLEAAERRRREFEATAEEYARQAAEHQQETEERRRRQLRDSLAAMRAEAKETLEAAKDERVVMMDRYREQADADQTAILSVLGEQSDALATAFADSVIKGLK